MQVYPPLLLLNRQGKCKYFILNPKNVFWWSRHLGLRPHLNSLTMKIVLCRCSNKKECSCSSHERNKTWIHTRKTIPLYDQSITNLKKRIEMIFFYENQYFRSFCFKHFRSSDTTLFSFPDDPSMTGPNSRRRFE